MQLLQTTICMATEKDSKNGTGTKKIITDVFKFVAPIAISALLVLWLFKKVDLAKMEHIISTECDFFWVVLMMVVSIFSHIIRGIRWGIQLRGAGLPRVPVMVESVSIFGAYALNLLIPMLGEGWRCVYMARRENASLSTVVGTDLGDRFSDAAAISLLIILSLFVAHDNIMHFIDHYSVGEKIMHIISDPSVWITAVASIAVIIAAGYLFRKESWMQKVIASVMKIWNGFRILFTMKGGGMYLLLTAGIWICYYLETYLCFFAFPFTRALIEQPGTCWGLIPGLVAFVFGSVSIAVPSNGGLGPWNIAVMFSLSLYGISDTDGAAFSMVLWTFKSAMLVALGIFSAIYIMAEKKRIKTESGKTSG